MARELFQAVQTAENNADRLIQEAQKEARDLIKTTQTEIVENERSVAMEHRAMYQSILDEKRESVLAQIEKDRPGVEKAQQTALVGAREKLPQVAQRIFERVWHDGDR
jgi:vacuolar-type H+-ATPase subunit H